MNETKTELIALRVTPEFKAQITKNARKENRTVSNYLTLKILEAIKGN